MSNPVLVEVTRGKLVESRHRGAVAVADADGATVLGLGDVAAPIFPRSAIKAVQALVLAQETPVRIFAVPLVCALQVLPLVVARMTPPPPTAVHTVLLAQARPKSV